MVRALLHPSMGERLTVFYPSLCTIQEYTEMQDPDSGEITKTWANLADHIDLSCAVASTGGQEVKMPDQTYVVANFAISFPAQHPAITELMRAVVSGITYDILLVVPDSHTTFTKLLVRTVT